jgi:predicted CXXCH cytochrome family protein
MRPFHKLSIVFGALAALLIILAFLSGQPEPVQAHDDSAGFHTNIMPVPAGVGLELPVGQAADDDPNAACYACHAQPGMTTMLPSGEVLYLTVDPEVFNSSIHGQQEFQCIACHTNITGYPHPEMTAQTLREFELQMYPVCANCHQEYAQETKDSVHGAAQAAGNENAAVCTDCHGAHNVQEPGNPRSNIPLMCQQCHSQIYAEYRDSVHGAALIGEGNPDVPTCTDCHGVHSIQGPSVNDAFKLNSPLICAKCHADEELMNKYGISTNVFHSYISDFHGTTTLLFAQTAEGQDFNTPVCIDCHGVHDIASTSDPERSLAIKENILAKCQRCHPDANTNFPDAWLNHYEPSPQKFPLVYYVNLFYKIFIPGVLGFMAVLVVADFGRKVYDTVKGGSHTPSPEAQETAETPEPEAPTPSESVAAVPEVEAEQVETEEEHSDE